MSTQGSAPFSTDNGHQVQVNSRGAATSAPQTRSGVSTRIRVVVVDDHPAVRAGVRDLLALQPDLEVLADFDKAVTALSFAERNAVDVAVVDYQLGGRSGLWLSRRLRQLDDPPAVLIYSAFSDWLLAAACVVAGACGLVSKTELGDELAARIREAAAGESRLPEVAPELADCVRRRFDAEEQSIFAMMLAQVPGDEISRVLRLRDRKLDETLWAMLSKLERVGGDG